MKYINQLFNRFKIQKKEQIISKEDIEFVINERLIEKTRLEKMLKTMRWQAQSQLEEIKNLNDKISDHKIQKDSLLNQIGNLNIEYLKILESYKIEQEKLVEIQIKLTNLDSEKLKIDELNQQISFLEKEYSNLKHAISFENETLKRLKNEKLVLIKNKVKINSILDKKETKKSNKFKKPVRCKSKTKSNHRCKNHTLDKSGCCHVHKKKVVLKQKMKIVNLNS